MKELIDYEQLYKDLKANIQLCLELGLDNFNDLNILRLSKDTGNAFYKQIQQIIKQHTKEK